MKKTIRASVSILLVLMMCLSSLSPFAIALSGNVDNIDTVVNAPEHDISVMSFNILEYDTSDVGYAGPRIRAPYVIATIQKYMPDIVGIQEAADPRVQNDNLDWNDYIATELGKLGYGFRQLSQESAKPTTQGGMTIGAGLMILYKTDRFELKDHGSAQYGGSAGVTGTYQGYSSNDTTRFYHWVKLWDKEKETYVYTFNTHLSINPSLSGVSSEINTQIGHHRRTQELKELIQHMERVSTKYPCFATGDYNTHWNAAVKGSTTQHLLYNMTDNGIFDDSGLTAPIQITHSDRMSNIDHVFYNKTVSTALQSQHVYEDFGSIQPSDHKAVMSYFNYGTTQTFTSGNYDPVTRTFTDTTEEDTYSLPLSELPEYITYRIFDKDGQEVSEPLALTADTNRFTLRFYNESATESKDKVFGETNLIIRTTAALLPTVTATNSENVYYAGGAYHILVKQGQTSTTVTVENGKLQNVSGQNISGTVNSVTAPISTYRIKGNDGDIYPLYIYKPTLSAESGKHLYIDDDIADVTGTVAFSNEDGVIYLTAGANGFSTLTAAAAVANTANGYTLHLAPGCYKENTVSFTKTVSLLGNNAGISPLTITDNVWGRSADRRAESNVQTPLIFREANGQSITVKGIRFTGTISGYVLSLSGGNTAQTTTLDIANNIFESSTTSMGNSSCIFLNTSSQKKGSIRDNYMRSTEETATSTIRCLQARNPNGLVFEQNWCIGFTATAFWVSSEVSSGNKSPAHGNFTVQYNRFENCANIYNYIQNVTENTSAHYKYLYNDFVRCGYPNANALYFGTDEAENNPTYFQNTSITVFGNRFVDCSRGLTIGRTANMQNDMREMSINVQQNRFIDCNQFRVLNSLTLAFYGGKDKTQKLNSDKWDFSHNYFTSDNVAGHDPVNFVNTQITTNVYSVDISKLCYPYYTNPELTWLSDSTTAPKQTGITITDNRHEYDGLPHSLTIQVAEDAVVSYSLTDNSVYSMQKPNLTEPGTLTVYYQVERPGYQNFTGRALITVTTPKRTLTMANMTVPYDGKSHSLSPVYNEIAGDRVSYTFNGIPFDTLPTFTNTGSYTIAVTVENEYATPQSVTATATLTITAGEITGVTLEVTDEILLSGTAEGDTVLYSVDGGTPSAAKPTLTGNEQSIAVTVTRKGYNDLILIASPSTENQPFTLSLTKSVAGEDILWSMSMTPDREMLRTQNITLLAYGFVTADTADKLTDNATSTPVRENETGILSMEDEVIFTTPASAPTAAYATYIKNGTVYTVYSTIGAK